MPGVLDTICGELAPTKTYAKRRFVWVPCDPATSEDGREGTLVIVLQRGRKYAGAASESDCYGVQEDHTEVPPGCRAWILLNETRPADEDEVRAEEYRVVVPGDRSWADCTCKATQCRAGECKHKSSILALLAEGVL